MSDDLLLSPLQLRALADPQVVGLEVVVIGVGPEAVQRVLPSLIERYELLRVGFTAAAGLPVQRVAPDGAIATAATPRPAPGAPVLAATVRPHPDGAALRLELPVLCGDLASLWVLAQAVAQLAHGADLPPEPLPYLDAVGALRDLLQGPAPLPSVTPWSFARPTGATGEAIWRGDAPAQVHAFAAAVGATAADVVRAGWQAVLQQAGDGGGPLLLWLDGRADPEVADTVGLLGRLLPVDPPSGTSFRARVEAEAAARRRLSAHQETMVLGPNVAPTWTFEALRLDSVPGRVRAVAVDGQPERALLALRMIEQDGSIHLKIHADQAWLTAAQVARLGERLLARLDAGLGEPDAPLSTVLGPDEHARIRALAGGDVRGTSPAEYPSVYAMFAQQAHAHPDAEAVWDQGQRCSYGSLYAQAEAVAAGLAQAGVGAGDVVAVLLPRGTARVAAVLGALRCGAVLLPMEPDPPPARWAQIASQAQPRVVLTAGWAPPQAPPAPAPALSSEDPAYLLYTSGTTGAPKGVLVPHGALSNHLCWRQSYQAIGPGDRFLHKAPFGFDIALWEILHPLIAGATVVLAPPDAERDPARLIQVLRDQAITTLHTSPGLLGPLLEEPGLEKCVALQDVYVGGEPLTAHHVARFFARLSARLHHQYGPTEATIDCAIWRCAPHEVEPVPIGRPVAHTALTLCDPQGGLTPLGAVGEIVVSGRSVALGYVGGDAARFRTGPWGERSFYTGDRGWFREDGALVFVGRADRQVKIRGQRVEPGEVEQALRQHPAVQDARVAPWSRDGAPATLVAWVVAPTLPNPHELGVFLANRLPEAMIPSRYVPVARLPLDARGKLDAAALAQLVHVEVEEPQNEVEELVGQAWQEVLGHPPSRESFFAAGGDSIRVIQLVRALERRGLVYTVAEVMAAPTVRGLARTLQARGALTPEAPPAPVPDLRGPGIPADAEDAYPLSALQALMFDTHTQMGQGVYHVQAVYTLHDPALDEDALVAALHAVARRHPALRTVILPPVQVVRPALPPVIRQDLRAMSAQAQDAAVAVAVAADLAAPFGPGAPLTRFTLLRRAADSLSLLISNHHAVRDGWSRIVLLNEVLSLYDATRRGERLSLPSAGGFREYVAVEQENSRSDVAYADWQDTRRRHIPSAPLPAQAPTHSLRRAADVTVALRAAREQGVSLRAWLLSAWLRALGGGTVAVVSNGRSRRLSDPLGTIGLHWNLVPFVGDAHVTPSHVQARLFAQEPFVAFPLTRLWPEPAAHISSTFNYVHFHHARWPAGVSLTETHFHDRFHFPLNLTIAREDHTLGLRLDAAPAWAARAEQLLSALSCGAGLDAHTLMN